MPDDPVIKQTGDGIPYKVIATALKSGNLVPFLGAGASAAHRPKDTAWTPGAPFGPFASELARYLANEGTFPDESGTDDLMLVASYFESDPADRPKLQGKLDEIFSDDNLQPGPIHRLLAGCPKLRLIMTTNYDNLIEKAFDDKIHVVVDHGEEEWVNVRRMGEDSFIHIQKQQLGRFLDKIPAPTVFKLHGTAYKNPLEYESDETELYRFVLTEDDYVRVLGTQIERMPAVLKAILNVCGSVLFLGYGLADWNVRVLLSKLKLTGRSWAVQHNPLKSEQKIWEKRGVNLYRVDLGDFVDGISNELSAPEKAP